ncbi:hypothetical protein EOD29_22870 [Mesorhizobium sp. M1A.T.Ca.IN.004.03.1.1]|uniref:hypothetical protein n=1 Tax=Mesorhizobium sp. M1A.T.Ca.IN.004.03.1.1 TaxID=2496795 RepID=UPI000FCB74F2|nr:hypothetical protein [Mesorhizobium sp. M1A.T.Ca.IN.004.03.1.1]RUV41401.1 hypothetical protein EOD29_22870 [Mesorhizobium sp. M1A.T.Ca.IN.004.03.1.1]
MTAPDPQLEAYVAAAEAALADLRRYIGRDAIAAAVAQEEEPTAPFPEPDRRPELIGKDWIEAGEAASRFNISKSKVRRLCRDDDRLSWKVVGRWYVSVPGMRATLGFQ